MSSRSAAQAALTLYAPCARRGRLAQWAASACIAVLGPRALPGPSFPWLPMIESEWATLDSLWQRELGAFDEVTGYSRLQADRAGAAILLLRRGVPTAFVKLRRGDAGGLANEGLAMRSVWRFGPRSFRMPEPLGSGSAAGWHYLASAPLPPGRHHPPDDPPLRAVLEETEAALAELPRPQGTPGHWRPMHGDFAPWNLRQLRDGSLALIDWEDAGFGPPDADEVFYRATSAALWGKHPARSNASEAVEFWLRRVQPRPATDREHRLAVALGQALSQMGASAAPVTC